MVPSYPGQGSKKKFLTIHLYASRFTGSGGQFFKKEPELASGGNLYLTDTLANKERLFAAPVGVIFCNPPYSRHSFNKGHWISKLVKDYYRIKGSRIDEKNLKGLQDDYVKFFRAAHWKIDQTGSGVIAFIDSNSYLENPTSNISREMWEFEVCGYQVLKKWLLDRKKRLLTPADIHHYIKICRAIQLTTSYCDDIDVFYAYMEETL